MTLAMTHNRALARGLSVAALLAFAAADDAPTAHAFTGADTPGIAGVEHAAEPGLEVAEGPRARAQPAVTWNRPPAQRAAAWERFVADTGTAWTPMWDADTAMPLRIAGAGMAMPGSVASADKAADYARAFLAEHIDLLAPGSRPESFHVVGNDLSDGVRAVGLYQYHEGMRVLGGQLSFRFKNDRLILVASEALPDIALPAVSYTTAEAVVRDAALSWVAGEVGKAWVTETSGPYVLPVISTGRVSYHTVMQATVEGRAPTSRYRVYIDASSGEPVAREQMLLYADAQLLYNVPARYPEGDRADLPASFTEVVYEDESYFTDGAGVFSWDGEGAASVSASVSGELVTVSNQRAPDESTVFEVALTPAGTGVWDARDDEFVDAQLTTFVHSNIVKEYVRVFAPGLKYLDEQLLARVNIDDTCNAFSDGTTINFFRASGQCANTGRLPDVVYHEFGHSMHWQSLVPGVGAFDGAFSEGLSDYLAATITGDPAMARGFFYGDEPLRHLDPEDFEHSWPRDIAGVHYTGLIFGGAMWDLRKELVALYGEEEGVAVANRLYYAAVLRASSIPATYFELLAADDDDGNLANGTPHECLINDAFGALHGLREIGNEHIPLGIQPPEREGYSLSARLQGTNARCAGDEVLSVIVRWQRRGSEVGEDLEATLQDGGDGVYEATIPAQPAGSTVRYQVVVEFANGGVITFPDNPAWEYYEFYVGELIELYCTDFESDPYAEGWSRGQTRGVATGGANDWQWGRPLGKAGDPAAPYSGAASMGNDLGDEGFDGFYQPQKGNYFESPVIDVGDYSDVRLQYRRWLTVEDSRWDDAIIYVNGRPAWRNRQTPSGKVHHIDKQWMFHDVSLSGQILGDTAQLRFALETDGGLQFGGWNIDDVCIVAAPDAICGNGTVEGTERCDAGDANSDTESDACRTNCRTAFCGDGVRDRYEQCDDGNDDPDDGCTPACFLPLPERGCSVRPGGAGDGGAAGLALLALLGLVGRAYHTRRRGRARA